MGVTMGDPIAVEKELTFVYNVNSDLISRMIGFSHKVISPQTYPCKICSLTWSSLHMQKEWAEFIRELPFKVRFEYRDQWKTCQKFPLVLLKEKGETRVLLYPEQINKFETVQELIRFLKENLGDKNLTR